MADKSPADVGAQDGASRLRDTALAIAAVTVAAALVARWADLGAGYVARAAGAALLCAVIGGWLSRRWITAAPFSTADRITLTRASLVMLVVAMAGEAPAPALAALALAVGTVAALLDAVDGAIARRRKQATAFGARFDMETDALFILALSVLAWTWDKAGVWILLAGLARYLFVAGTAVLPFMNQALPPSRRRQTVCVVQVVTLLVCIAPWIPSPLSDRVAGAGLVALVCSFLVDLRWLYRSAPPHPQTGGSP